MSAPSPAAAPAVRRLAAPDRSRWRELWRGYLSFYQHVLPEEVTEFTWQRLLDPAQPLKGCFALDGEGHGIGFVHYHFHLSTWSLKGYCYLEDLFVDPACRSRGTGRALIEAVFHAADEQGVSRVYWHTENTNARAQILYNQVAELAPFLQYRRRQHG